VDTRLGLGHSMGHLEQASHIPLEWGAKYQVFA
jgi:hypothetical protein